MGVSLWAGLLLTLASLAGAQESIESQLAPQASSEALTAEQSEAPKLPVESIDPTPHLPGIPSWLILLGALIVAIPLILLLLFILRKAPLSSLQAPGPSPFDSAKEQLLSLRELPTETPLAEISTRISLALRRFLTQSKSDAALYQTREEFLTDEERLRHVPEPTKSETAHFLSELSSLQYAPPSSDPSQVSTLIEKGLQTLESLHQPEPTLPAAND
ncbi:MAG: hypothetical protein ACSHYB_00855 [Roseibacillus sp.]